MMEEMKETRIQFMRFLSPMKENGWIVLRSFLKELSFAVIPLVHIFFIQQVVVALETNTQSYFWESIYIYISILIIYEIGSYLMRGWWRVETVNGYRRMIHHTYVWKLIQLDNTVATSMWTGKMLSIVSKWMDVRAMQLQEFTRNSIVVLVTFLYAFVSIFVMEAWYAGIFLVSYILVHVLWVYINSFSLRYRRGRHESWTKYTARLVRIIMSKYEILQSWETQKEIDGLNIYTAEMDQANNKMKDPIHRFFTLPEAFISRTQLLVVIYVWSNIFSWTETLSTLVWLFWIFTLLWSAIKNSMDFFREFTNQFTTIEYMRTFFDTKPTVAGYNKGDLFMYHNGNISLQNLSFWYDTDWAKNTNIFSDISFDIHWGTKTAFVWPSWWWKSTLVKLIVWYLVPDEGSILVDDQDLGSVSKKSWYSHVWYLTQEPNIFDWTIKENLLYWMGEWVREEKITEAIRLSKCDFIYDFSDWIETEIGERWIRLSWWQRQRLAIAKIFIKDPHIILLDEPTSALDSESEKAITDAMNNLFIWRTVIIIAHRLQTVKHADDIILIDQWRVIERWTHEVLMKQWWKYTAMVELQSGF